MRARISAIAVVAVASLWLGTASALALDVNVRNAPYEAVGNGTTNDRAAIQEAIDDVAAAEGGGTVTLPGGYTFLSGDLDLKSGVTLEIEEEAILRQSQNPAHYLHEPNYGRHFPGSPYLYDTYLDRNYPLIYAGEESEVEVTGDGKIELTYGTHDEDSILVHGIGFNEVTDFVISDLTIDGASAYNVAIRNSENGEVENITTTNPNTWNSDGVSMMNSSHLSVHNNDLTTLDDGIYVWASYADPRKSEWWDSDTPRQTTDIEVYENVVDNQSTNGSHGFVFINWTEAALDQSQVEISNIHVHDNEFKASYPIGALNDDPYYGTTQKTPSKDLRFEDNVLTVVEGGSESRSLDGMATTNFAGDDAAYNFGLATNITGIYNSNFDGANAFETEIGTSFWSVEGGASAPSESVGQPSGRYGQIDEFNEGYAGIYQGVYLEPGTYKFTVQAQSSGADIRLFAIEASTVEVKESTTFSNTEWEEKSITFAVTAAGNYRLGIDNYGAGGGESAFGRIDNAELEQTEGGGCL